MAVIEVPDWYRTVALVGVDITGEPVVVLLDSTGAIIAVMKGEYAGTLKNVKVDSEGRMIMIPTDPADVWGNAISMGNAELVARMTGLGGYDRRGNCIFFDTFEDGLAKGTADKDGTGAAAELSSHSVRSSSYSLKLTAGSDAFLSAWIQYWIPYPIFGRLGVEISFTIHADTGYIFISFNVYDGTTVHSGQLRYNVAGSKIQYVDSAGAWQDLITGVVLHAGVREYHTLKMVIDISADTYHRVLVDGWSWTTGGIPLYTDVSGLAKTAMVTIRNDGLGGTNPVSYIDNMIVTQNEPA